MTRLLLPLRSTLAAAVIT